MSAHVSILAAMVLSGALQATPPATAPRPAAQTQAARPGSLVLTVTASTGEFLAGATVAARGPADRGGPTGSTGTITLQNMPAGTYRCRISRDGFITLEKEITIRAGVRSTAEAVLSAAPPPPPPPPPPAAPAPVVIASTLQPGQPRAASLPDLAEQMLRENQPVVEREIGCSGATSTRLIVARDNITLRDHPDADETLYLLAGEATLRLGDDDRTISAGWVGVVPRRLPHSVTRRGRNPLVLLSVRSGPPCTSGSF